MFWYFVVGKHNSIWSHYSWNLYVSWNFKLNLYQIKLFLLFFAVCCIAKHILSIPLFLCITLFSPVPQRTCRCKHLPPSGQKHHTIINARINLIERLNNTHHFGSLPAFITERFHREPPQVKMTARINSRPHSLTPYVGSSMGWTPETSRHTANTTAFNIMLDGWGDLNKTMLPAPCRTTLYVALFCNAMPVCDLRHLYIKGVCRQRLEDHACRPFSEWETDCSRR